MAKLRTAVHFPLICCSQLDYPIIATIIKSCSYFDSFNSFSRLVSFSHSN